jgi:Protein of unknown function (DUF3754)
MAQVAPLVSQSTDSAAPAPCSKKVPPPSEKQLKADPKAAENFRRDRRGIFVKRFDEVAVADVEIVFPDKEIGLKLIDKLTLFATALVAVIGGLVGFFMGSIELSTLLSVATTIGGKLYQARAAPAAALLLA